ncbi:circularly permuted type 2 ATP-grasp protein [Planctomycetota bacterium]
MRLNSDISGKYWDQLLRKYPEDALQDHQNMCAEIAAKGLTYADRIVPCVLKPNAISTDNVSQIQQSSVTIVNAVEKVTAYLLSEPEHPWWQSISASLKALLQIQTPLNRHLQVARLDGCVSPSGNIYYLECNGDSPAGFAYAELMEKALLKTRIAAKFKAKYPIKRDEYLRRFCSRMLKAYYQCRDNKPNIAITDWRDVKTLAEFRLIADKLEARGYSTVICDPRDFRYRQGNLYCKDKIIDMVYRRVILDELAQREGQCKDFIKAVKEQAVVVVNPFISAIASCKQLLARIRMGEFNELLTANEIKTIRKHIPFTYRLNTESFKTGNQTYDTLTYTLEHQDKLVIKPMRAYGGKDIHFGSLLGKRQWKDLITAIRKDHYICQKLVKIPETGIPVFTPDMKFTQMNIITNPFIVGGDYGGCLTRLAHNKVVNIGTGGMVQATFTLKV